MDEILRLAFAFPSKNPASSSVIKCVEKLFAFTGIPSYIHAGNYLYEWHYNAPSFVSRESK